MFACVYISAFFFQEEGKDAPCGDFFFFFTFLDGVGRKLAKTMRPDGLS